MRITDAQFHGAYALQVTWNDGHRTGLFPFEALRRLLFRAARRLDSAHVLMLNKDADELFDAEDVRRLFASVAAQSKSQRFFPGSHDDWGPDLIDDSLRFLTEHAS